LVSQETINVALSCGLKYMWCDIYFDILNRLRVDHKCGGRTDGGRTDEQNGY